MNSASKSEKKKKRILVVNVFFDDLRMARPAPYKVPQAMGHVYLAGAFSIENCDVRVHDEHHSGPLVDESLLGWPDMLVLTGLTVAFDRMLHLTAYARTGNPGVIVVAGGPAIRALPEYSARFFDYCCLGDIEEIREVVVDALGRKFLSEVMTPRYETMQHYSRLGYAETSRNCNFKCSFCSLTGERSKYRHYSLDKIRREFVAMGKKRHVVFLDNNFYGNDRKFFLQRLQLLADLRDRGYFRSWSALVTNDFFSNEENLALVRETGCESLFSGFESFDRDLLRQYNKKQNMFLDQVDIVDKCRRHDIVFTYGIMLDLSRRRLAEVRDEIEFILYHPRIPLPSYFSLTIPLPGTPYFDECVAGGTLMPNLRLRDLNGYTITTRPLDPIDEAVLLVKDLPVLRGYRGKIIAKGLSWMGRYRKRTSLVQQATIMTNILLLCAPSLINNPAGLKLRLRRLEHVAGKDALDPVYEPLIRLDSRYRGYFEPTMVTDSAGALNQQVFANIKPAESAAIVAS